MTGTARSASAISLSLSPCNEVKIHVSMSISHSERLPSGCIIITHKPGFLCHILGWGHVTSPQIHVKHKFTFWPRKGQHHRSLEKKVLMKYRTHSSKDKDGNSQNDTVGIVILKVSSHLRKKYCPMDLLRLVVSLCQHCFGRFHLFFRGKGFPPTYPFGSPFQKKNSTQVWWMIPSDGPETLATPGLLD